MAAHDALRKTSRPSPAAVAQAVPIHQVWRSVRSATEHSRQFRRQAEAGRRREDDETAETPEQPFPPAHGPAAQREDAGQ